MLLLVPLIVALVALTASANPQRRQYGGPVSNDPVQLCRQVLQGDPAEEQLVTERCASQLGLTSTTINNIKAIVAQAERQDPTPERAAKLALQVQAIVIEAGRPTAISDTVACVTRQQSYYRNGMIHMGRLKEVVLRKALGTPVEEQIWKALETCPPVRGLNIPPYLQCVTQTCARLAQ